MAIHKKDILGLLLIAGMAGWIGNYYYPRELKNQVVETVKNNDHYADYYGEFCDGDYFVSEVEVCVKEPSRCFYSKDHDFLGLKPGDKLKVLKYTPYFINPREEIVGYEK